MDEDRIRYYEESNPDDTSIDVNATRSVPVAFYAEDGHSELDNILRTDGEDVINQPAAQSSPGHYDLTQLSPGLGNESRDQFHFEISQNSEDEFVKEEVSVELSSKEIVNSLGHLADHLSKKYREAIACYLMSDKSKTPFLKVVSLEADEFLVDSNALKITCHMKSSTRVLARLLTYNRNIVKEIETDNPEEDVIPLVDALTRNHLRACVGFSHNENSELFWRLRKSDYFNFCLGIYSGELTYRARKCEFFVDTSVSDESVCEECRRLFRDFSKESVQDTPHDDQPSQLVDGRTKKKRGRPRKVVDVGEETDEKSNPSLKEAQKDIKTDIISETSDDVKAQQDSTAPISTEPRRGLRRRMKNKRRDDFLDISKRKRGRPPILTGPFECNECGLKIDAFKDFKKHRLEHTNSFVCDFEDCDRRFKSEKDLEIHTRKHRGEKPYVCVECDKSYQLRQDLKLHMRKHTGVRPFKCELCPKSFARAQQRKVHMAVHTGERAHLCFECGASFGSVSTLIDHRKRRHLMVRNHPCTVCSKSFFTRQELFAHSRTHTGDKPYQCTECDKRFSRVHHLKRHISGVHRVDKSSRSAAMSRHTFFISDDQDNEVFASDSPLDGDTVLVSTDSRVLNEEDQFIETEYIVHGSEISESDHSLLIHKLAPSSDGNGIQYLRLSNDLESTSVLVHENASTSPLPSSSSVVDITGSEDTGEYVLITTTDNEQKLVPVAHFVSAFQQ